MTEPVEVATGSQRPEIAPVEPPKAAFASDYPYGSILVDTAARALYFVLSATEAYRYPIAIGTESFDGTGEERITAVADWPDWTPSNDMREERPDLPRRMKGGLANPLGARAISLGQSPCQIHGTNELRSIDHTASSGCFRMLNEHVVHLAGIVSLGSTVTVVERLPPPGTKVSRSAFSPAEGPAPARDYNEARSTLGGPTPPPAPELWPAPVRQPPPTRPLPSPIFAP